MAKIVNPSVIYRTQTLEDTEKERVRTQIKAVEAVDGKGLSTYDYTAEDKTKLAGITVGAEENTIESISANGTALTPDTSKNVDIPAVSTTADGLMLSTDKAKLDGIEAGAQKNVAPDWNAASGEAGYIDNKPTIPTKASDIGAAEASHTHAQSDITGLTAMATKLDGIEAGAQKNVTPDWDAASGEAGYIDNKPTIPTKASDIGAAEASHTHAQSDITGLTAMATKLDGIEEGAQKNVTPDWNAASGEAGYIDNKPSIPSKASDIGAAEASHTHAQSDITGLTAMATKLDGIEAGAQKNVTPDWNAASGEAGYIDNKPSIPTKASDIDAAEASHTHAQSDITGLTAMATKLDGIEAGAQKNVTPDWNAASGEAGYIDNKPSIPTKASDIGAAEASHTHAQSDITGLTAMATKLDGIEAGAQVNVIEKIKVNGTEQTITDKTVDLKVSGGGTYTNGDGISISADNEISVNVGNGLTIDDEKKVAVDSEITDAVDNAHTLTSDNGVEIVDDTTEKTTTIKLNDDLYGKISSQLALEAGDNITFDASTSGKLKISASGGIGSVETDGTTIVGNGTSSDKIRLASTMALSGTADEIVLTAGTDSLAIGLAEAVTTELSTEKTFREGIDTTIETKVTAMEAKEISSSDTGLATAAQVAGAIGDNVTVAAGDGITLTQASATAPLVISMSTPIVIETDTSYTPTKDGKIHMVVMENIEEDT